MRLDNLTYCGGQLRENVADAGAMG